MYTSDIGAGAAQLFAAPVTSSEALADLESIDPSDALEVRTTPVREASRSAAREGVCLCYEELRLFFYLFKQIYIYQ